MGPLPGRFENLIRFSRGARELFLVCDNLTIDSTFADVLAFLEASKMSELVNLFLGTYF